MFSKKRRLFLWGTQPGSGVGLKKKREKNCISLWCLAGQLVRDYGVVWLKPNVPFQLDKSTWSPRRRFRG